MMLLSVVPKRHHPRGMILRIFRSPSFPSPSPSHADFCNQILVGNRLTRSARFTSFCTEFHAHTDRSSLSIRNFLRIGSSLSIVGAACFDRQANSCSLITMVTVGSALSLRSFSRLGQAFQNKKWFRSPRSFRIFESSLVWNALKASILSIDGYFGLTCVKKCMKKLVSADD